MEFLMVSIGGISGAIARYKIGLLIAKRYQQRFPLGTFVINMSGSLILGFILGLGLHKNLVLLLVDGFLGTFTTFSTLMLESYTLSQEGRKGLFFLYLSLSVIAGIAVFIVGFGCSHLIQSL